LFAAWLLLFMSWFAFSLAAALCAKAAASIPLLLLFKGTAGAIECGAIAEELCDTTGPDNDVAPSAFRMAYATAGVGTGNSSAGPLNCRFIVAAAAVEIGADTAREASEESTVNRAKSCALLECILAGTRPSLLMALGLPPGLALWLFAILFVASCTVALALPSESSLRLPSVHGVALFPESEVTAASLGAVRWLKASSSASNAALLVNAFE
jgi:hypothetical protein